MVTGLSITINNPDPQAEVTYVNAVASPNYIRATADIFIDNDSKNLIVNDVLFVRDNTNNFPDFGFGTLNGSVMNAHTLNGPEGVTGFYINVTQDMDDEPVLLDTASVSDIAVAASNKALIDLATVTDIHTVTSVFNRDFGDAVSIADDITTTFDSGYTLNGSPMNTTTLN